MKESVATLLCVFVLSGIAVSAQAQFSEVEFMVSIDRVIPPDQVAQAERELAMAVERGDQNCQAGTEIVDSIPMGDDPLYYKIATLRLYYSCESAARAILSVLNNDPRYTNYADAAADPFRVRFESITSPAPIQGEIIVAIQRGVQGDQAALAERELNMIFVRGTSECWAATTPQQFIPSADANEHGLIILSLSGTCPEAADAISDVIRNDIRYKLHADSRTNSY